MTPKRSQSKSTNTSETWRSAFLRQARSDYEIFRWMNTNSRPLCHQLHYLQMAAEKLAKAFLCGPNNRRPQTTHTTLVRFMRATKTRQEFRNAGRMTKHQFKRSIDGLLPTADAVEKLAPEGSGVRPNPEYPWETAGTVTCPLDYDYPTLNINSPQTQKLLKFIRLCMDVA